MTSHHQHGRKMWRFNFGGCNTPKSHILTLKWENILKPILNVNYVTIKELKMFKWRRIQLNNSLTYIWTTKNDWDRALKLRSKFGHSKVHSHLLVHIFVFFFLQFVFCFLKCITYWVHIRDFETKWYWKVHSNFQIIVNYNWWFHFKSPLL